VTSRGTPDIECSAWIKTTLHLVCSSARKLRELNVVFVKALHPMAWLHKAPQISQSTYCTNSSANLAGAHMPYSTTMQTNKWPEALFIKLPGWLY
jgi:hypothetical protein